MAHTDLSDARLCGTNLFMANLFDAIMLDAQYDSETVFPDGFSPGLSGMLKRLQVGASQR